MSIARNNDDDVLKWCPVEHKAVRVSVNAIYCPISNCNGHLTPIPPHTSPLPH